MICPCSCWCAASMASFPSASTRGARHGYPKSIQPGSAQPPSASASMHRALSRLSGHWLPERYHLLWGLRQSCLHRQHDLYPRAGCRPVLSRNSRQNAAGLGMGFCLKLHRSDAVILAVTNVKRAALDEDAVRPLEAASESIAVRAIAAVAGPDDGRNYSRSQIDASNDMAFRVGYIKCAF